MLRDYPPGTRGSVKDAVTATTTGTLEVFAPELQLICDNCLQKPSFCQGGVRAVGKLFPGPGKNVLDALLLYSCRTCGAEAKSYAVRVFIPELAVRDIRAVDATKLGEWPAYSPPTPSRVNSLIGPDRELFFKGRASEAEGLGIGAFAYYRRIVEDQKTRLVDEIIRVARRTNTPADALARLEAARAETQFSKAVEMTKDAVPPGLLIKGHNPLTLLHSALSGNLHGASDAECLRDAHVIRVILCELADRLGDALKDQKELDEALNRLLNPSGPQPAGR
jgi:hypothetical protein